MKNMYRPLIATLLAASLFTQTSCSKDTTVAPNPEENGAGSATLQSNRLNGFGVKDPVPDQPDATGAVFFTISPIEAKPVVVIYNQYYNSGELTPYDLGGFIKKDGIAPGIYSILITPRNPDYLPLEVSNIVIEETDVTNLGEFILRGIK